jgi:hypothetical protein
MENKEQLKNYALAASEVLSNLDHTEEPYIFMSVYCGTFNGNGMDLLAMLVRDMVFYDSVRELFTEAVSSYNRLSDTEKERFMRHKPKSVIEEVGLSKK